VHGRCGELAALTALRDIFGIRERPDIGPGRSRTKTTKTMSPNEDGARPAQSGELTWRSP
jgi:hypothetical protein